MEWYVREDTEKAINKEHLEFMNSFSEYENAKDKKMTQQNWRIDCWQFCDGTWK